MNALKRLIPCCFILMGILSASQILAAPVNQTLTLNPGWNAVFLEVTPDPTSNDPISVFGAIPDLISVWRWNSSTSTVEFIQDPRVPVPEQSAWLAYYHNNGTVPAEVESLILTNLFAVHGNTAYLIQRAGTADVNYVVSGEPAVPDINWETNTFNFIGFHLVPGSEPTFTDFFSSSAAHADQTVYVLQNGIWVEVTPSDQMRQGEAFWIYCKGSSSFNGPLDVRPEVYNALNYGSKLDEQILIVANDDDTSTTVTIAPTSAFDHLYFPEFDSEGIGRWIQLGSGNLTVPLLPGASQRVRLGVKRTGLTAGQEYLTNLAITDSRQRILVPVSVTGINFTGLWSGYATINKVSEVRKGTAPESTGSTFSFRLLVHVDTAGNVRLLQQVIQMWQQGTWKDDPDNPGFQVVDVPGHYVLLTDDSLISQYSGAALLDGRSVGRRVSSAAFGFSDPQDMTGSFSADNDLTVTVNLDRADPLNPFVHQYHPKHFKPVWIPAAGDIAAHWSHHDEEMFAINRTITLKLRDADADGNLIIGSEQLNWGSNTVGGIYEETISGLNKDPIDIQGTFVLHKISAVAELTSP